MQRAQKGNGPIHRVLHQQQDAFFAAQSQLPQRACHARDPLGQFAVAKLAAVVDIGGLGGASGVQGSQMAGEVEFGGAGVHGCLLMSWWGRAMAVFFWLPWRVGVGVSRRAV
ncbi:hypothetical protein D3C71_1593980 [compost metagenome]